METNQLYRGRLIDHLQLVVRNFKASRDFYTAVLDVLEVPIAGTTENYFWADELVVSSVDSPEALGVLTGRHHLAFQAKDRATVDAFYRAALTHGGRDNGAPGERAYHQGTTLLSCLTPTGTTLRPCTMARRGAARRRW